MKAEDEAELRGSLTALGVEHELLLNKDDLVAALESQVAALSSDKIETMVSAMDSEEVAANLKELSVPFETSASNVEKVNHSLIDCFYSICRRVFVLDVYAFFITFRSCVRGQYRPKNCARNTLNFKPSCGCPRLDAWQPSSVRTLVSFCVMNMMKPSTTVTTNCFVRSKDYRDGTPTRHKRRRVMPLRL